jgi:basic membrane protein A and related proteins
MALVPRRRFCILVLSLVLCIIAVAALAGCGSSTTTSAASTTTAPAGATTTAPAGTTTTAPAASTTTGASTVDASKLKVAFVTEGQVTWPGWYNQGYISLQKAEQKYGFKASISEMATTDTMAKVFTQYAEQGYDLVWAHASAYDFGVPDVAKLYPKTKFLITGGRATGLDNMVSYDYNWRDATYLGGVLASKMSKAGKFGFTIGEAFPTVTDLAMGAKVGFLTFTPSGTFMYNVAGTWGDLDKGKNAAQAQIDAGADVVGAWAGTTGQGVAAADEASNVYYIAEDQDRGALYPKVAIGYAYYTFDTPIMNTIDAIVNNTWKAGSTVYGMDSQANLALLDFKMTDLVPADVKQAVEAEKAKMIAAGGVDKLVPGPPPQYALDEKTTTWFTTATQ